MYSNKLKVDSNLLLIINSVLIFLAFNFLLRNYNLHFRNYIELFIYIISFHSLINCLTKKVIRISSIKLYLLLLLFTYISLGIAVNILVYDDTHDLTSKWRFHNFALPMIFIIFNLTDLHRLFRGEKMILLLSIPLVFVGIKMVFTAPDGSFPSLGGMIATRFNSTQISTLGFSKFGPVAPATIGGISAIHFFILFFLTKNKILEIISMIGIIISLTVVLGSGGRTATLSLFIVVLFIGFNYSRILHNLAGKIRKLGITISSILVVGFYFFSNLIPDNADNFIERFKSIPSELIFFGQTKYNDSGAIRIKRWQQSIDFIKDEPLGLGFYNFHNYYNHTPHNEYLHQLLNTGIFGGIIYITFIFSCVLYMRNKIYFNAEKYFQDTLIIFISYIITLFIFICGLMESFHPNLIMSFCFWFFISLGVSKADYLSKRLKSK